MNKICLNGKILPATEPALMVDNKSFRYGDGLFETMKVIRKTISLEKLHFDRFFSGLQLLGFSIPPLVTAKNLAEQILLLCGKNNCEALARVRLSAFRGNGGISEGSDDLQYVIECWPLSETVNQFNENGLIIEVYPDARKSCDKFSNIKSSNYLPYTMAARYGKENKLNDCLVLNIYGRIADSSIANVFIVKDEKFITPSLGEGCVNGVLRRWLLEEFNKKDLQIKLEESVLTIEDLLSADEIFLTNAVRGVRWVKQFRDITYTNLLASKIQDTLLQTIWR